MDSPFSRDYTEARDKLRTGATAATVEQGRDVAQRCRRSLRLSVLTDS